LAVFDFPTTKMPALRAFGISSHFSSCLGVLAVNPAGQMFRELFQAKAALDSNAFLEDFLRKQL
jgi:hypothetical protein